MNDNIPIEFLDTPPDVWGFVEIGYDFPTSTPDEPWCYRADTPTGTPDEPWRYRADIPTSTPDEPW